MKYRAEIDGMRAIAVVPVILFHADIPGFSGGYVGVDVFFVLSGYLISGIILDDLEQGRFSLLRFYERRARRILPVLFLTLVLCSVAAWYWFLPRDLRDFSQSLAASALFVSNLIFLRESGYFDLDSELKPLLHTWSLSIEEQYYILFPLMLGLLFRWFRRQMFPIILAILRYLTPAEPAISVRLLVVCAIFPLARLSWTYVETPFRSASVVSRRSIFSRCSSWHRVIGSQRRGYLRFDLSPAETATQHSLGRSIRWDAAGWPIARTSQNALRRNLCPGTFC